MTTKLTLELPAGAAKKLAILTPAQLAGLDNLLGYGVMSYAVQPSESTRRSRANAALYTLTTQPAYHDSVPWVAIDEALAAEGFDWQRDESVVTALGSEGRVHYQVGDNAWLVVSWYRMSVSGCYGVVAYVS
jgi:hypothetical protein